MFKEPLKHTGIMVLVAAIVIIIAACFTYLLSQATSISVEFFRENEQARSILAWVITINVLFVGAVVTLIGLAFIHLYKFIRWLFIEPYQARKKERGL